MAVAKFQSVQKRLKEVEKRINFINQALEKSDVYKKIQSVMHYGKVQRIRIDIEKSMKWN